MPDSETAAFEFWRTAAARCAGWFRRWSNSARGPSRTCRAGGQSLRAGRKRHRPDRDDVPNGSVCHRRRRCRLLPDHLCWRACKPSAVIAAASGWPKMPNTPHSFTQAVGVGIELRISHGACGPVGVCASLSRSTCPGLCQRQFRGAGRDLHQVHPDLPVSAFSASLRWCFQGHPATSTSAIVPYFAALPSTWRREPSPAGCGQAPTRRKAGRRRRQ